MPQNPTITETVIALFEFEEDAQRAADKLVSEGFDRGHIQIITGHQLSHPDEYVDARQDVESKLMGAIGKGLTYGGGVGALAGGIASLLVPGFGPLIVGGALATTFAGAGLGASVGGVMAALMKAGVDESNARLFEAALRHGGVVLTVGTAAEQTRRAVDILDASGALDMDEHADQRGDRGLDKVPGSRNSRRSDGGRDHSS